MSIKTAIHSLLESQSLTEQEMSDAMQELMTGQATDAQIGAFLAALRVKGETVAEIKGAASVMRALAQPVQFSSRPDYLVDTCGTGGDGSKLFNVSTASAIVAAACGAKVAKHGNRSVSSKSGSADVLEIAGVNLNLTCEQVATCVTEIGLGFMFAPAHHGAMKYAIGPRRELAARTLFNLLGPLTNPARAENQVLGVFAKQWVRPLAQVLQEMGSRHVMVVHAQDGLDELSIAQPTWVAELRDGEVTEYVLTPEDVGLSRQPLDTMMVSDAQTSLALINKAFRDAAHPAADMIALNAGAAIYVAGVASSLKEGVDRARDAIGAGLARSKLSEYVEFTRCYAA